MTLNNNVANFTSEIRNINSAPIIEINQEIEKIPQKIGMAEQDILNLAEKLREVETQCRAMGDTTQANKLKEMLKIINAETTDVKGSMKELRQYIEETFGTDALKQFDSELKNIDKTTKNIGKQSSFGKNLKTALGIGTVALGIRKGWNFLKSSTNESVDFVETQNLFNVSMGRTVDQYGNLDKEASKYYTKAIAFQEKLEEKLGINIAESMNYQALFNAMSKSMGIASDKAYLLSENFTKLGYDLSSLYNIDPENAMQKLRAGLSGQTKPLRDLGLDITQQSLEPLLDELGIERSAKQLSQAEKMVARYIVVLRQASLAHGDFAKTMDSPANQLRIFNAQITAFKRNMGNLWQGLLGNILPYVNAIMMVINELLKMVAKLFGFKVSNQNANISAGIGADDLADDLGTATDKAKELKKQLMGFDEINNIDPNKTKSGSGSASVGGIDQRLLDAMKEYDNLMDKVKSKATDIKNQIMKWLGFTGDANKDMEILKGWLDKIKAVAKVILALYIGSKLLKLIGYLRTLRSVFLGTKVPMTSFQNGLSLVGKGIKGTISWLKDGITQFKYYKALGVKTGEAIAETGKNMLNAIPKAVKLGVGIAGLTASSVLAYKSMEDLSRGTIGTGEAFGKLAISIGGATASGALIGSIFGPAGTAIGALTGLTISGISAFAGYKDKIDLACEATDKSKKSADEYLSSIREQKQVIQENVNSQLAQIEHTQNLINELDTLVDKNGKVKEGYEDRAKFILSQLSEATGQEWSLTNGTIEKYQELRKEINNLIETKKAEIISNANQEEYANAIKRQIELQHKKIEAQEDLTSKTEAYNTKLSEIESQYGSLDEARKRALHGGWLFAYDATKATEDLEKLEEAKNTAKSMYDNYSKQVTEDNQLIIMWEDLKTATITGDAEKINAKVQEITNTYETETGKQTGTLAEQISKEIDFSNDRKRIWQENGIAINEINKKQLEIGIRTTADKLLEQTNKVKELTPEQKKAWEELAKGNYDVYKEYLEKTEPKTREEIQNMTGVVVEKTPEVEKTIKELSSKIVDSLDNSSETKQKAIDAIKEYMNGLSEPQQRELLKQCGIQNSDKVIEGLKQGNLSEDVGINIIKGLRTGLQNNYWQGLTLSTAFTFATNVLNKFKRTFDEHSPSKKTKQFGIYLLEGLGLGIKKEENSVLKTVGDFSNKVLNSFGLATSGISQGIAINPQEFKIDTNQFIDYGQISGAIATRSNVRVDSNIEGRIENAIYSAFSNVKIPVEIEATTDEGVIFKKVQTKAREFYTQTGEPAFDF